ncbi:hypothetical protein pb186bvf_005809 [Paramecium bursaria]
MIIIFILSLNLLLCGSQQTQDDKTSYLDQKQAIDRVRLLLYFENINMLEPDSYNINFKIHINLMIQEIKLDEFMNIMFWIIVILSIGIFTYYFALSLQKPRLTPSCLYSENLDRGSKIPIIQGENIQKDDINILHQSGRVTFIKLESVIKYSEQRIEDQENFNLNQKSYERKIIKYLTQQLQFY